MGQRRGSARLVGAVMVCLLVVQYFEMVHGAVYTVGAAQGWTFNVASWPKGKRFRAGDTLGNFFFFHQLCHLSLLFSPRFGMILTRVKNGLANYSTLKKKKIS